MKITITQETKQLNLAVELFDSMTEYRFDRSPIPILEMEASRMAFESTMYLPDYNNLAKIIRVFRQHATKRVFVNACLSPEDFK